MDLSNLNVSGYLVVVSGSASVKVSINAEVVQCRVDSEWHETQGKLLFGLLE